jgi:DNA-binding NarL/FixJ family response regulator
VRVVIAEDHVLLADGLARLLAAHHHEVVASVTTGPDLIDAVSQQMPDIAVVDIRLPPGFIDEGLRAAVEIRQRLGTAILVLSQYVETAYARELLSTGGGTGYLLKDRISRPRDFVDALDRVAAGGVVLDPEAVSQIFARHGTQDRLAALTDREREVLRGMAEGRSNAAVAQLLVVTEATVEKHINNIFGKLGLQRHEAENRRVRAVLTYLGI